jgi:SAM-dependent methyltransferase
LLEQEVARMLRMMAFVDDLPDLARVLEVGTGYLSTAVTLRRRFPSSRLVGLEHPRRAYLRCEDYRACAETERIALVAADLVGSGCPFRRGTFDLAVFAEVIEHVPPDAAPRVLAALAQVLSPGGRLLLTTPNLAAWDNRELALRGHSPNQMPSMAIDGTHGHLRLYTMAELHALVTEAGLTVERCAYIDQVPVGRSWLRRLLRGAAWPARMLRPPLRDTCVLRAVRTGSFGRGGAA